MADATLKTYVDDMQAQGSYVFSREKARSSLSLSTIAFQRAASRLMEKRRIARLRNGLFVIVPLEYRDSAAPPASWFIDQLMQHLKQSYYVGLLSAASIHGSSHQQPQEFQVMTDKPTRPITIDRLRLHFFYKKSLVHASTAKVKTPTGFMYVATPEATAIDLVAYYRSVGYFSHVATVLKELLEKLNPTKLCKEAKAYGKIAILQRLGFLLDFIGGKTLANALHAWLVKQKMVPVLLRPDRPRKHHRRDNRWQVFVNDDIEVDV